MAIDLSLSSEGISLHNFTKIPQLGIEINVENKETYEFNILGYTLKLYIANVFINQFTAFKTMFLYSAGSQSNATRIRGNFNITPHLFNAIEESRISSPLKMRIDCEILCVRPDGNFNSPMKFDGFLQKENTVYYDLSLEKWHDLASKMGYKNYAIYEVSFSNRPLSNQFKYVIDELNNAKNAFDNGDYNSTIYKCRIVLDEISKLTKENKVMKTQLAEFIDEGSRNPESLKSKKINDILFNTYNFMHIAPHSNEYPPIGREDAEFALTLCYSIVQYYNIKLNQYETKMYT
ncbi:hypothetical protein ACSAZK_01385 [Methanosarcina sp. Mfa9]|uniref:hypothetical protein n=1 Tax=Methanosarcina sp. Mfa9 TaxID=3439063 RepID=UPI003F845DAF